MGCGQFSALWGIAHTHAVLIIARVLQFGKLDAKA
jgi:hypothetical protein